MSKILSIVLTLAVFSQAMCFLQAPAKKFSFLDVTNLTPENFYDFFSQFNEGFTFYANLPHQSSCHIQYDEINSHIKNFTLIIEEIKEGKRGLIESLPYIKDELKEAWDIFFMNLHDCQDLSYDVLAVNNKLRDYMEQDGYSNRLLFHLLSNIADIGNKVSQAIDRWNDGNYKTSGLQFGEVLKFTLFWDYKN